MISIIIPIYNLEKYIERALDSICEQIYQDLEIIVVDDGSTDNSLNIIKKYAKKDNRIITIHQENAGVTSARMNGIAHAKGEWIGFVDGDDEIEEDMYEGLLNNAIKYNADISHCGYQMIFDDGRVHYFYNKGSVVIQDTLTGLKDLVEGTLIEPGLCNKLFRRDICEAFIKDNIMDISVKANEDLLMNYYLFSKSQKSVFEDVCKYHYIVRNDSSSRGEINKNKIYDPIRVKEKIVDMKIDGMEEASRKALIRTCINIYNGLTTLKFNNYREDKKKVRKKILEKKESFYLLNKKNRMMAQLICYMPFLYQYIYRAYARFFQKKRYD